MAKKKDPKNPYPYDLKDLREAEKDFVIQLGTDFYVANGVMFFPDDMVKEVYDIILSELREAIKEGTEEEKSDAMWAISRFHIHPLRIH